MLAKPTGAACNLDCAYCFFLSKETLYPDSAFRMSDEVLDAYLRQLVDAHAHLPSVTVAWQGGEPTLMGLDFFRRSVVLTERYLRPGQRAEYTIQTNGTRDRCRVGRVLCRARVPGRTLDRRTAPDARRLPRDARRQRVVRQVMRGLGHLRDAGVEWNALTTIHAANAESPREVYAFLRDECGARFMQFIPVIERVPEAAADGSVPWSSWRDRPLYVQDGARTTARSVTADQYGRFLIEIFEDWVRRDVGKVYVQMFDVALANWVGAPPGLCVHSETCGDAVALEHTGDLYACDHFVEPAYLVGNIADASLAELVASPGQRQFGRDKRDTLPAYCRSCEVRFACHGGCPKDRFIDTPDGEPGLNYLCAGYKAFFGHIDAPMRTMGRLLAADRAPAEVMAAYAAADAGRGRNDACSCGSGRKWKRCHQTPTVVTADPVA